jgi:hypothetical protein
LSRFSRYQVSGFDKNLLKTCSKPAQNLIPTVAEQVSDIMFFKIDIMCLTLITDRMNQNDRKMKAVNRGGPDLRVKGGQG